MGKNPKSSPPEGVDKPKKSVEPIGRITTQPLKFGSRNDLELAITELTWINERNGKLVNQDFYTISIKYALPTDFLKEVIKGQVTQENFCVTKSKWYPIYYTWMIQDNDLSFNLYKLQFDYFRSKHWYKAYVIYLITGFAYIGFALWSIFNITFFDLFVIIVLPLIPTVIALSLDLRHKLLEKKAKLDDYSQRLINIGLGKKIEQVREYVLQNRRGIIFASSILLKKINEAPRILVDFAGTYEERRKASKIDKILKKNKPANKKIPTFILVENSDVEYLNKIKELAQKKVKIVD